MSNIAIIGGGLAGTACAYALNQEGIKTTIFEAGNTLAAGASGNPVALYNPRFFAENSPEAEFYKEAFLSASDIFLNLGEKINNSQHGSLHLITSEDKEKRFEKMVKNWRWHNKIMRIVSKEEASDIADIQLNYGALYLPIAGTVFPQKLCDFYAQNSDIQLNTLIETLSYKNEQWFVNDQFFDYVIFACGAGVLNFKEAKWFPIHTVRGQICQVISSQVSEKIQTNLNYGGYITPSIAGVHTCGSTFQKWLSHTDILDRDNEDILSKLGDIVPNLSDLKDVKFARASLRTASKDRLPIIGTVPIKDMKNGEVSYYPNLYVSTAHGSHGVVSSLMAAQMIANHILRKPEKEYVSALNADRFLRRALRQQ